MSSGGKTKRAAGKKLIGAQASAAIWQGVDRWLRKNSGKSVSDFVLEACVEKLENEGIPFDKHAAMFDGRHRVPPPVNSVHERSAGSDPKKIPMGELGRAIDRAAGITGQQNE